MTTPKDIENLRDVLGKTEVPLMWQGVVVKMVEEEPGTPEALSLVALTVMWEVERKRARDARGKWLSACKDVKRWEARAGEAEDEVVLLQGTAAKMAAAVTGSD